MRNAKYVISFQDQKHKNMAWEDSTEAACRANIEAFNSVLIDSLIDEKEEATESNGNAV